MQATEPELPLGTKGPGAQIRSVLDAATGIPISLTSAAGTVDVMALVALGPGDWSSSRVHADLAIRGTRDTTVALHLGSPPPSMVAHAFRVSLDALGPGRYSMRARVVGDGRGVLVESAPVFLVVPER